jgi:hypothetical protein
MGTEKGNGRTIKIPAMEQKRMEEFYKNKFKVKIK